MDGNAQPMDGNAQPIQIQLTEEQQQQIKRLSGQFAQVLELTPVGEGRGLQFRWRLSVASGIPRQQWGQGGVAPVAPADAGGEPTA